MTDALDTPLEELPGMTPRRREWLARLGLSSVRDLLFHLPRAYEDLTDLRPIAALAAGPPQVAQGEVVEMESRSLSSGGCVVSIVLSDDGKNILEGVWFNQPRVSNRFHYGQRLSFSGNTKCTVKSQASMAVVRTSAGTEALPSRRPDGQRRARA
jgi:ATP-dependent DNA helicase RecG